MLWRAPLFRNRAPSGEGIGTVNVSSPVMGTGRGRGWRGLGVYPMLSRTALFRDRRSGTTETGAANSMTKGWLPCATGRRERRHPRLQWGLTRHRASRSGGGSLRDERYETTLDCGLLTGVEI